MNCIVNSALALLKGQQAACPQSGAIAIAVVAFVLGMVAACLLCKVCRPCGKKSCQPKNCKTGQKNEEKPFEKRKPHPAPTDGSVEIYVGNLSYEMSEEQLRGEFEAFGTVNSARLIMNRFNGKSKGFGFVQMKNRDEAEKAIAALNDKEILGRKMKCNEAKNLI